MNQTEIKEFFDWCEDHIKNCYWDDCDESMHFYYAETMLGGWAGDSQKFFYNQSDDLAKLLRMLDAAKEQ